MQQKDCRKERMKKAIIFMAKLFTTTTTRTLIFQKWLVTLSYAYVAQKLYPSEVELN